MKDIDFKNELNAEQYAAATAGDGPMLILAAAGTGKTRTLVYRVAYLVSQGVDPNRILLLTFTNKAAREMLERANQLIGHSAGIAWNGTFHHVANRILRKHARALGYSSDYVIMDQDDSRTLMNGCIKELKLNSKEFPKKDVLLHVLSISVNSEISLEKAVADYFADHDVAQADVLQVIRLYIERKRELGNMDFDDMLTNCLRLLRENRSIRERYAEQFQYVLVDEYQDTNKIQADIVDLLSSHHRNLFVVGDDFQSIYSWRGADYRNIIFFKERYPEAQIYKLETNYRSVPEVLRVANRTVEESDHPEEFLKQLKSTREAYKKPVVARLRDGEHQGRFVVDQIGKFKRQGYQACDIAVLYRAHFHAMELQIALTRSHVPHLITSGIRFFEQAHIKDVLSLLRILTNPGDALAFDRLLCLLPGVGAVTAKRLWKKLGGRFESSQPAMRKILLDSIKKQEAREYWEKIDAIFPEYHAAGLHAKAGEIIKAFLDAFYDVYLVDNYQNSDSRLDDIRELGVHFDKFDTIEESLNDIALLTNLDAETATAASSRNMVRLSTIHQAKGLEWPVVIIIWATEGMFPSGRAMKESEEGEAEERRLFYVAATRAADELVMCTPEVRRSRDGGVIFCTPSRFVEELDGIVTDRRIGFI